MENTNEKDISISELSKVVDEINKDLNILVEESNNRNEILEGIKDVILNNTVKKLCQACLNLENECVCYPENDYCKICGDWSNGGCEGVHSVKRNKTVDEQAEEVSKIVLSYGTEITEKVIKYLEAALKVLSEAALNK